jgi:hypothetical protein
MEMDVQKIHDKVYELLYMLSDEDEATKSAVLTCALAKFLDEAKEVTIITETVVGYLGDVLKVRLATGSSRFARV